MDIREAYVSFETEKLLKEKGFDQVTDWGYREDGTCVEMVDNPIRPPEYWGHTIQMAMAWLRTKGYFITTNYYGLDVNSEWATVTLYQKGKHGALCGFEGFDVDKLYDDAIKFCLENYIK